MDDYQQTTARSRSRRRSADTLFGDDDQPTTRHCVRLSQTPGGLLSTMSVSQEEEKEEQVQLQAKEEEKEEVLRRHLANG